MNFYDFMRAAFGLHPESHDRRGWFKDPSQNDGVVDPTFKNPIWDPDEEDDSDSDFRHVPSTPFGFRIFSGDPIDMHRFFEQQFEDMLKSFGAFVGPSMFGSGLMDVPDMHEEPRMLPPPSGGNVHPQDRYLKPSFEKKFSTPNRKDSDIDEQFKHGAIQEYLPQGRTYEPTIPAQSFSRSVISRTIRRPDGGIEHHKTMVGSNGEEITTITRKLGDQSHTLTTTKKPEGQVEKTEELVNLNEGDLQDFEKKWSGFGGERRALPPARHEDGHQPLRMEPLWSFIERFFK